ncbi:MAG: hypothetical protein KVP17_000344 [Porospora cf. gigantea B]|uniref:uncharacterized protein n=1 Tax=Porospora cf. gigantea B TaxID=2853592 RepID=UPI003571F255|nr:MAG: hypothetical protein KVP17_000344 [Porospora cf. gigantea B]
MNVSAILPALGFSVISEPLTPFQMPDFNFDSRVTDSEDCARYERLLGLIALHQHGIPIEEIRRELFSQRFAINYNPITSLHYRMNHVKEMLLSAMQHAPSLDRLQLSSVCDDFLRQYYATQCSLLHAGFQPPFDGHYVELLGWRLHDAANSFRSCHLTKEIADSCDLRSVHEAPLRPQCRSVKSPAERQWPIPEYHNASVEWPDILRRAQLNNLLSCLAVLNDVHTYLPMPEENRSLLRVFVKQIGERFGWQSSELDNRVSETLVLLQKVDTSLNHVDSALFLVVMQAEAFFLSPANFLLNDTSTDLLMAWETAREAANKEREKTTTVENIHPLDLPIFDFATDWPDVLTLEQTRNINLALSVLLTAHPRLPLPLRHRDALLSVLDLLAQRYAEDPREQTRHVVKKTKLLRRHLIGTSTKGKIEPMTLRSLLESEAILLDTFTLLDLTQKMELTVAARNVQELVRSYDVKIS